MSPDCQVIPLAGQSFFFLLHLDFNVQLAIENLSLEPLGVRCYFSARGSCVSEAFKETVWNV